MTITITISPELERRLAEAAGRQGIPVEQLAVEVLEQHLPSRDRRADVVSLLQSWIDEGDAAEEKETGDYLLRVLDEDRLSDRKLFPPDLKGVSW
jgi:hypothetical protein